MIGLEKVIGSVAFNKVIDIISKRITDKNEQKQVELELRELDIEELRIKKSAFDIIFHRVFPIFSLVLALIFIVEFFVKLHYFTKNNIWLLQEFAPQWLIYIVVAFLFLLMPKKILEVVVDGILKYIDRKIGR